MHPCCCLLLAIAALLFFITCRHRPVVVNYFLRPHCFCFIHFRGRPDADYYFLSAPPCLLRFGAALLLITRQCCLAATCVLADAALSLSVARQCRPVLFIGFRGRLVVVYYSSGTPCVCLLFFGAALVSCSTNRHRAAVVYYLCWGRLDYYVSEPCWSWLRLAHAALLLFITRRCCLVVVYCSPMLPCCL